MCAQVHSKQHTHKTSWVWNRGAQQARARTPTSSSQRTPYAQAPNPRTSPDSRVTFQVRSLSPPRSRPCVSAYSPTPPSPAACGAGAELRSAQPSRAVSRTRRADPGLRAPRLGLCRSWGCRRARCGQKLRLRCCRPAPPRGPVQRRHARREGGKKGGEEEKEGGRGQPGQWCGSAGSRPP